MPINYAADYFSNLFDKLEKVYIQKRVSSRNNLELRKENGNTRGIIKRGVKTSRKRISDLSVSEQCRRKVARAKVLSDFIKSDPEFKLYIEWMKEVQKELNLDNIQFARALGHRDKHCPDRMLRFYYEMRHFPSRATHLRLIELSRRAQIRIVEVKNITNIKNLGVTKNIQLPRLISNTENHVSN